MNIETLTRFFMWCTIINGAVYFVWVSVCLFASDFLYGLHGRLFHLPRETFDTAIYSFLGVFKIVFLVLNLTPFLALLIIK